jgi:hypothetical protein
VLHDYNEESSNLHDVVINEHEGFTFKKDIMNKNRELERLKNN